MQPVLIVNIASEMAIVEYGGDHAIFTNAKDAIAFCTRMVAPGTRVRMEKVPAEDWIAMVKHIQKKRFS